MEWDVGAVREPPLQQARLRARPGWFDRLTMSGMRGSPRTLLVAHGTVSRWDGTTNVIVSRLERLGTRAPLPSAHDWR